MLWIAYNVYKIVGNYKFLKDAKDGRDLKKVVNIEFDFQFDGRIFEYGKDKVNNPVWLFEFML